MRLLWYPSVHVCSYESESFNNTHKMKGQVYCFLFLKSEVGVTKCKTSHPVGILFNLGNQKILKNIITILVHRTHHTD